MGIGNIATTGMQAAMTQMEVISNNIANVSTNGFKSSTVNFADLFPVGSASNAQAGLGVSVNNIQQNFATGDPEASASESSLLIQNNGFFVMKDATSGGTTFTRNGQFNFNNGYLMLGNQRLQGFPAVNNAIPSGSAPSDLFIDTSLLPPKASSELTQAGLNLDSNAVPPSVSPLDPNNEATFNFSTESIMLDSLGNEHPVTLYYINTSPDNWSVSVYVDDASIATGSLVFDTSGALTTPSGLTGLTFPVATGAATPQTFSISMTGATQVASDFAANEFTTDGYQAGDFAGYTIDVNGNVNIKYTNKQSFLAGQIAVATFQSPQGLQNMGNMSWASTTGSGTANITQSNSQNAIKQFQLESSNVDLAAEMVNLISAQSIFQANAQVQQTYTQVMQTVTNL